MVALLGLDNLNKNLDLLVAQKKNARNYQMSLGFMVWTTSVLPVQKSLATVVDRVTDRPTDTIAIRPIC